MNVCAFVGNLTRDSELRELGNNNSVLNFSLAVNDKPYKNKEGDWVKTTSFLDFELFGKQATTLSEYLLKGKQVAVTAVAKLNQWEDGEGKKRSRVVFKADDVRMLGGKPSAAQSEDDGDDDGGDIPF